MEDGTEREAGLERLKRLIGRQAVALSRRIDALAAEPSSEKIVLHTLQAITDGLAGGAGTLWAYDQGRNSVQLYVAYSPGGADHPAGDFGPDETLRPLAEHPDWRLSGERFPFVLDDVDGDPRLSAVRDVLRQREIASLLVVPLWLGVDLLGSLVIAGHDPGAFRDADLDLAASLGREAVLCILIARANEQARRSAVSEERSRIARELHDTVAQGFVGVLAQLEAAAVLLETKPSEARLHLERAGSLARTSIADTRRHLRALRPLSYERLTLTCALAQHVSRMKTTGGPLIACKVTGDARSLTSDVENELFRIAQEAIANALRHSEARAIHVVLSYEHDRLRLSVKDDGKGFLPDLETMSRGFGILGMHERAGRIGYFTIVSEPGEGTEVIVVVDAVQLTKKVVP